MLLIATNTRSNFIVTTAELEEFLYILNNLTDNWDATRTAHTVEYRNRINICLDYNQDDYVEDWNRSVMYLKDNREYFESGEGIFTISALGTRTGELITSKGSLYSNLSWETYEETRFLVECPEGKNFKDLTEATDWVRDSIFRSYGVTI